MALQTNTSKFCEDCLGNSDIITELGGPISHKNMLLWKHEQTDFAQD